LAGTLGASNQAPGFFAHLTHRDRLRRVRHEAVLLDRDIKLYQITLANPPGAGYAMYGLVVDADAVGAGELIYQRRSRLRPMLAHDAGSYFIQFRGGNAGSHLSLHGFEHSPNHDPRGTHAFQFFRTINGHRVSLTKSPVSLSHGKTAGAEK
jgi:hypothetical protein